jgi:alpha-methylacyl-CoA racemase
VEIKRGSIEPQFYKQMIRGLGLSSEEAQLSPYDPSNWPQLTLLFQQKFKSKTRQEWTLIFEKLKDACVAPVLEVEEVMSHEHHQTRQTMVRGNPQPCPRLERTPGQIHLDTKSLPAGGHTREILLELGYSSMEVKEFVQGKVVKDRSSKL